MASAHILQFGRTGQLGQALASAAENAGVACTALGRDSVDLEDVAAIGSAIESAPADVSVVVNAAAYTAVDLAEDNEEAAFRINADAPAEMARACAVRGLPFVHVSTDYVFDGTGNRPYREDDATRPLGVYGRSKLAGEEAIFDANPDAVVIRTSWVFSETGRNFLKTMVGLADREVLTVVDDQYGCPTAASDIADLLMMISGRITREASIPGGIYHFSGQGVVTWCGFARAIFAYLGKKGMKTPLVQAISSEEYPTAAARPAYSVMDCSKLDRVLEYRCPSWQGAMERSIDLLMAEKGH